MGKSFAFLRLMLIFWQIFNVSIETINFFQPIRALAEASPFVHRLIGARLSANNVTMHNPPGRSKFANAFALLDRWKIEFESSTRKRDVVEVEPKKAHRGIGLNIDIYWRIYIVHIIVYYGNRRIYRKAMEEESSCERNTSIFNSSRLIKTFYRWLKA